MNSVNLDSSWPSFGFIIIVIFLLILQIQFRPAHIFLSYFFSQVVNHKMGPGESERNGTRTEIRATDGKGSQNKQTK